MGFTPVLEFLPHQGGYLRGGGLLRILRDTLKPNRDGCYHESRRTVSVRQHGTVYTNSVPVGPFWLWMTVRGKEGALKKLEETGKLPISHMWLRYSIAGPSAEGVTDMIDMISVPAEKVKVINDLRNEISLRAFFTWRTWSMKENAQHGDWVIKVVYADSTPVICDGNKGCEYKITIK